MKGKLIMNQMIQFDNLDDENLNAAKCRIYKSKRGKGGGTFAEMLSADRVKSRAAFGNQQCSVECNQAANDVAAMIRNALEAA